MKLQNVAAIVTGGASGMGAETARALTKAGAKVALFDVNQQALAKVAEETGAIAFTCDVTNSDSVSDAIKKAQEQHGVARVLINCAGIAPGRRIVGKEGAMPLDDFSKVININLIGTFNVLRLAAEAMSKADTMEGEERGVIINTASVAAYEGQIGQAAYSASKAGVIGMTLPAARELARFGIRVVTIAPGLIETPMLAGMSQQVQDALIATTLYPKRLGYAREYADLALHIVHNQMLNGCVIRLDGAVRLQP